MAREKSKQIAYETTTTKKVVNNNKDNNTSDKNNVDDDNDGHSDGDNKTQVDQYIRMLGRSSHCDMTTETKTIYFQPNNTHT